MQSNGMRSSVLYRDEAEARAVGLSQYEVAQHMQADLYYIMG